MESTYNKWMWWDLVLDEDIFLLFAADTQVEIVSSCVGGWWCPSERGVMGFPISVPCLLALSLVRERWGRPVTFIASSWSTQYWITVWVVCSWLTLSAISPTQRLDKAIQVLGIACWLLLWYQVHISFIASGFCHASWKQRSEAYSWKASVRCPYLCIRFGWELTCKLYWLYIYIHSSVWCFGGNCCYGTGCNWHQNKWWLTKIKCLQNLVSIAVL